MKLSPDESARALAKRDPALRQLIRAEGPPPHRRSAPVSSRFPTLARAITGQLLATKAAATIHARIEDLCDGDVTPSSLAMAGHRALRGAGLSNAKAAAMLDLAERARDGRLRLADHGRMSDDDVLRNVVEVKGVGPWTAHMYLMHTLGRHDIWPAGDFGVRAGWSHLHGDADIISEADLRRAGDPFVGYRSDLAWYCWHALHLARAK